MGFETSKQPPRRVNIAAIFSRSSMKRILSIFLCLTLILGFCPGQTAYAAAEWPSEDLDLSGRRDPNGHQFGSGFVREEQP